MKYMLPVYTVLLLGLFTSGVLPAAEPAGARDILTENSYYRWHVTLCPPTYKEGGQEKILRRTIKVRLSGGADELKNTPPPAEWARADFDDALWPRSRLSWCRWLAFSRFSTVQASFRGKFNVTDPNSADLYLSMKYIGGAVIYLNGREVHRADMPAGKVGLNTYAKSYEDKFYVDDSGKPHSMRGSAKSTKCTTMRTRNMTSVKLPKAPLKAGINVLGIEIHRSVYSPLASKWFASAGSLKQKVWWPHADLAEIRLKCAGGGVTPNIGRPAGVQVWVQDRNDRVTPGDYGDPNEKVRPIRIVGTKNGSFCGQAVIGSSQAFSGVKVTASDIKGQGGSIPAKNITVLYGRLDWKARKYEAWSHGLLEKSPESIPASKSGAVLPVLIRVKIPADAKAGDYKGNISVAAGGKNFILPLELYVADWKVPDAKDFRMYMGVYQSPTTLAMRYKVKLWSEEHWKLIEKSMDLLGRIGNKMINVPVVEETQFGNDEGMVRWIKKGNGWEHDFSVMERYIDTAVKHCGKQDYVCLQIWHAGGWSHRKADNKCTVTVIDKAGSAGKKVSSQQVPVFGTPESVAFWKPVLAEIKSALEKRGMVKAMTVGILSDSTAPNEVFEMFKQAWPNGDAMWHRGCHGVCRATEPYSVSKVGGNKVQLHEHCYGMSMVRPDINPLPAFYSFRGRPGTAYFRVSGHENATTLVSYRTMAERGLFCGKQGIGRICLDYFSVLGSDPRRQKDIYNRFPHSSCAQRQPTLKKLVWDSPEGPATTMRYEALCEGVQESDALLVVSEGAAKAGGQLAKDCEKCIRDHIWYAHNADQHVWATSWVHMNHYGWQELSKRTFDLAGKVSKALGK
ncbi:glycoside hydrolase domain-containing protein [Planctomycetota bacterium]